MRQPPDVVFAALRAADPDLMDRDELAELTGSIAGLKAWCDALQVRATRRLRALAAEGRSEAPRDLIANHGGETGKGAKDVADREQVCTALPIFEEALATGAVSAGHVDAISHATKGLDEPALAEFNSHAESLLADAERNGIDVFERNCRDLARFIKNTQPGASDMDELERQRRDSEVKRWTDKESGMRLTLLKLDPVRDAQFWAGVTDTHKKLRRQPGNDKRGWGEITVDAVVAAVQGGGDGKSVTRLNVMIDSQTMTDGLHPNSICELSDATPLPVSLVRQMAAEAEIIPIVLNGQGRALDVGMTQRLATPAQRDALRAMYSTCGDPDCVTPFEECEAHHVRPVNNGGPTDLANLLPLCKTKGCHTKYHEGGWTLEIDEHRHITITRPDGTIHYQGPSINRAPNGVAAA